MPSGGCRRDGFDWAIVPSVIARESAMNMPRAIETLTHLVFIISPPQSRPHPSISGRAKKNRTQSLVCGHCTQADTGIAETAKDKNWLWDEVNIRRTEVKVKKKCISVYLRWNNGAASKKKIIRPSVTFPLFGTTI
jgi:hypothetical protein